MTKKHFIALADFIKDLKKYTPEDSFSEKHIQLLSGFCGEQNPNFNRARWLSYIAGTCGKNGGSVKKVEVVR